MNKQEKVVCSYLAANIRLLRKRKGLSQEELGQSLGLNRGNIASYEAGTAEPKICYLFKMASFFEVSLVDLAQRNLKEVDDFAKMTRLHGLCPQERAKLSSLRERGEAFDAFLQGIHTCFQYKSNHLAEDGAMSKEAEFLISHFEQLHSAAKRMSKQHLELLKMCEPKEEGKAKETMLEATP